METETSYIFCPNCKGDGGYDFCLCGGGGGYSVELDKKTSNKRKKVISGKIDDYREFVENTSKKLASSINASIESKLIEIYGELSESIYNDDIIYTLKKILRIRRGLANFKSTIQILSDVKHLKEIVIDLTGHSFKQKYFDRYTFLLATAEFKKAQGYIPLKNRFFQYDEIYGITIKVTETKRGFLSESLFLRFISALHKKCLIDIDESKHFLDKELKTKMKEKAFIDSLTKMRFISRDEDRYFIIEEKKLGSYINEFFIWLQNNHPSDWEYV